MINKIKTFLPKWFLLQICRPIARNHATQSALRYLNNRPWLTDEKYIKKIYKIKLGMNLNLENPVLFNEKNNWRKLYDRKPIYTSMVDKYKIKDVIKERIGSEYTFSLLGMWKNPSEIDLSLLPDKFVLKTNHAGGVIICRDKNNFDLRKAKKELSRTLKVNYYLASREWPYKNVERCIICEKYMGENLIDYKIYTFNGQPKYIFIWKNISREDGRKPATIFLGAYNFDWQKIDIKIGYPTTNEPVERPNCLDKLFNCASNMADGTNFVRVDCYIIENKVYVGELTFFPWGGFMKFEDDESNKILGELQNLPLLSKEEKNSYMYENLK